MADTQVGCRGGSGVGGMTTKVLILGQLTLGLLLRVRYMLGFE